jgi:hypothetical protein
MFSPDWIHLVLPEYRLAFLHVPKCGGTTVKQAIAKAVGLELKEFKRFRPRWSKEKILREGSGFLKFAVVRNPYDRLVSYWEYNVRGVGCHEFPKQIGFREMVGVICNDIAEQRHVDIHYRPISQILTDDRGELIPDIILQLETLEQEWTYLRRTVEKFCRLTLPSHLDRAKRSDRKPYQQYYDDYFGALV